MQTTPAIFVADTPGLDFLNSIAVPTDVTVDWISDGAGLVAWLRQSGLIEPGTIDQIVSGATHGELDKAAVKARELREWFRQFVRGHMGRPLEAGAVKELEPLNRLLEGDDIYQRIVFHNSHGGHAHLALQKMRRWRSPDSLLIPIGEAIARTIVEEDFSLVKSCEGSNCTLLFADHTRGHARRWCSMSVCGNRAKVAAHRSRRKGQQ